MKNIILFDDESREDLKPFTYTRPVSEIRIGISTIKEKWEQALEGKASYITEDYLTDLFPLIIGDDNILINAAALPNDRLLKLISQLEHNEALLLNGELIATRLRSEQFDSLVSKDFLDEIAGFEIGDTPIIKIQNLWDIFQYNRAAIEYDFQTLVADRSSQPISSSNHCAAKDNIFLEEGAKVECAILNARSGPIYVGKNATIMEGSMIKGPVVIGDHAVVKMGAKIYGPTTIGPHSKVGGEIKRSVLFGYSNKSHDGYLGDSVLGEWCNLGADTNVSNLKNNYSEIKIWNYVAESFLPTGQQFCGLMMGDHSKTGINTMLNTGTVVGVSCNVFGSDYPRNFIPSFSWGGRQGLRTYALDKAKDTAARVLSRKSIEFDGHQSQLFDRIFDQSSKFRRD